MQRERREEIRRMLGERPFLSLDELAEAFPDVSGMTLRRDIEYFEERGEAIKVRGGARSMRFISPPGDDNVNRRTVERVEEKRAIAEAAVPFLETGRSIFIDSGSTMRTFAKNVPPGRFSFTTTDPAIALELLRSGGAVVNMVGGRLEGDNQTVTGLQATRFLTGINIDIAFLCPSGYSEQDGFTVANFNECELKRIVTEKARLVIMLMDSSKCGRALPYTFCTAADADVIITDRAIPETLISDAQVHGVRVIQADIPSEGSDTE